MLLECVMNVNKLAAKVNDTHIFLSLNVYSHICISLVLTGITHISLLEGQDGVSRRKSTIYLALQAYSLGCLQCTCKGRSERLNYLRPVLIWYFPKHFYIYLISPHSTSGYHLQVLGTDIQREEEKRERQ